MSLKIPKGALETVLIPEATIAPETIIKPQKGMDSEKVIDISECRVTLSDDIPKAPTAISYKNVAVGTLGNISCLIGKAKSRKTFALTIMTSALAKDGFMYGYMSELPFDKKKILYFDTEQSKYHVQLVLNRIYRLSGVDNVEMFALRPYKPNERVEIIREVLYNTPNIGVVIIDGIRDLIFDINSPEESTNIVTDFMKWSQELDVHIITVLHQNKGDNNARGHIGTELINKAETVLSVSRSEGDDNISIVKAEQCRGIEPEDFAFEIDDDGLPIEAENVEIRTSTRANPFNVREIDEGKYQELFETIFKGKEGITYNNLQQEISYHSKDVFQVKIGTNRAKEIITHSRSKGWIVQVKDRDPYKLGRFDEEITTTKMGEIPF